MVNKKKKSVLPRMVALGALLSVVALIVYGRRPGGWFGEERAVAIQGAPVRRGFLEISVIERGNLEAKDAVSLRSEVEGRTTILSLIDEGTHVEAGDIVAELDATELVDRRVLQEDRVLNARAIFTKAKASLEIQKTENESLIARAKQEIDFAGIDLRKFIEGDRPQQTQKAEEDIILAKEELANAEDQFKWSSDLLEGGFLTRTEFDRDELAFKRAEIMLDQAKRAKRLLLDFEHEKQLQQLQGDKAEAIRELRKVELQASAQLVDQETALHTSEARLKLEEKELAKINDQIGKAVLIAPIAGMVVYGREDGGRWRGDDPVSEGGEIRERQEIIRIPRSGGMIAKASIHESVLKQVQVGQEVIVRVDAIPSREFRGRVDYLAVLPDQNSYWANPNLRVYKTEISIADEDAQMRPGMSCSVEILVDHIEDTLYVPVQAITHRGGKNYCFVASAAEPDKRTVEIGSHNSKWVAIDKGLEEGESVLLTPPLRFLQELEAEGNRGPDEGSPGESKPGSRPAGLSREADSKPKTGAARKAESSGGRSEKRGGKPSHAGGGGRPAEGRSKQ